MKIINYILITPGSILILYIIYMFYIIAPEEITCSIIVIISMLMFVLGIIYGND